MQYLNHLLKKEAHINPNTKASHLQQFVVKLVVLLIWFWMLLPLAQSPQVPLELIPQQEQCQAVNIYFEARGESLSGKQAILEVVNNRVKAKGYPSTQCGVIFQRKQFSWTHQQPYDRIQSLLLGDTTGLNQKELHAYNEALLIAYTEENARLKVLPSGVLFYHASSAKPDWRKDMKKVKVLGLHIFYRK